jgi:UTRA domain
VAEDFHYDSLIDALGQRQRGGRVPGVMDPGVTDSGGFEQGFPFVPVGVRADRPPVGLAPDKEAGLRLAHIREELATRMPVGPETVLLRLPEGTPVVELIRTTYDTDDRAVEVMVSVIAGDMASFCYDFPIPD